MPESTLLPRRSLLLALAAAGLPACGSTPPSPAAPAPSPAGAPTGPGRAASQLVGPTVADRGSPHYRFERFEFDSADGERHYRVQLAVPRAAPPAAGFALLLMLDGNAAFGALTEEMLAQQAASGRPVAIAALGYQTDQAIDATARAYDYTPPVPGHNPTWDNEARQRLGGGADVFLALMAQRVLPEVRRRVPVDAARSTLWGHSYGGLCALYALFTRPALFARYAAADPSLWWHDGFILDVEQRAQALPTGRPTALLLMAGGGAAGPGPAAPAVAESATTASRRRAVMADAAPELAARQARRPGLSVQWLPFPGVGHGAMRPASITPTLQLAAR
ncbi:alpha/beta hydrolase-fold protein [Xenophilus arseniciresistens]|uniref:Acyl-CoA:diacylglycerol acyltransferase n=1 Tax=Xenophilus arseniciresistens TaxID=1283306 RepID=A0AAE3T396_9BURK|nr:alpha/beta hydrolase-fold protein [Xenophilus arseniciresistens]MDA7419242.1 alpha/beta hydrolase-fold protein [Xenophilus arseniciresistens]